MAQGLTSSSRPPAETSAEPSLQAKQLQLKRARLADDLNDKISHRPGPIELVHKNILPVVLDALPGTPHDTHRQEEGRSSGGGLHLFSASARLTKQTDLRPNFGLWCLAMGEPFIGEDDVWIINE